MPKQVLFRDDFAGPSLDLSSWTPNWLGGSPTTITPPINGAELSCYDPEQVSIVTHALTPAEDRAGADSAGNPRSWLSLQARAGSFVDFHGSRYKYASGCVTTAGHHTFTPPVRVTARVWLPRNPAGLILDWPVFWMDGGNWPTDGEIDIVEGLSGHSAYHFHSTQHPDGVGASAGLAHRPGDAHGGSWHEFGVLWTPDRLDFEYDHVTVGSITEDVTDKPMFLAFNLGVGGYGGPLVVPAEMRVDYVEVEAA